MTSTEAGMSIEVNQVEKKAWSCISTNFELRSNVTDVSELHHEKQLSQMTSTEAGM
jgi:hypothetical protein